VGVLIYGNPQFEVSFDDRVLAHLQLVIGSKLRRGESFFFSWRDASEAGDGRSSIWVDSAIPLYFHYFGSKAPKINREWLEALTISANSTGGLQLCDEPENPNN
jgi:hypothetical protein